LPAPANPTEQGATTPDNSTTSPEQNNPSELPATGALNLDDQTIIFSPTLCIMDDEDVLIDAPGINQSSMQAAFLSIDLSMIDGQRHGEARIELGVNDAFS